MAKNESPNQRDLNERVRLQGERTEKITANLMQHEIEEQKTKICRLLDQKDELKENLKGVKSEHKAKSDLLDEQISVARRMVNTGRVTQEITVEEYLTAGNEIVRVRKDTGEVVGKRTATARELQEELFPDAPPPLADQQIDDAFGADGS